FVKEREEVIEEDRSKFALSIGAIAVKYVEKLKERREELKEADASPMPHSLAIPRGIHELMNKKKNQVVAGEGPFSLKNRVKVYVQGNSLQIDTTAETDASPMRHSLAIPRDIPKKTKGLLGIKTKSEKKLWELKNSQDFEDKESELKRRDPLVGHVKKTCYMPVVDLNFGKLSGQPVEEM
ncbi:uncharacterized protein LOC111344456, partial [Stylophora pistillata]|uniref:uncharacterized protein LOC111344456 n=1 Tax=Stylophora pistillata TaxID=50429 RepID=UPI000C042669